MPDTMKKIYRFLPFLAIVVVALLSACVSDDTNYDLNILKNDKGTNTEIKLEFDTLRYGGKNPLSYASSLDQGQHLSLPMKVTYAYPERLKYTWLVVPYANGAPRTHQVGNSVVYEQPDTIGHSLDLDYTVNLSPTSYQFYLVAEDTVTNLSASLAMVASYQGISINKQGQRSGLYLLTETQDGNTDLEIYTSKLMLIYGGDTAIYHYYSGLKGQPMPGKPRFIRGASDGSVKSWTSKAAYMVATDKGMYRLSTAGLETMDTWNDMFYSTPGTFNPQKFFYTGNCEFLLNDGKLYTLYTNKANSRKFSSPIAGDYTAYPFLMKEARNSYSTKKGVINAAQVLFDSKHLRFIPYYSQATSTSTFKETKDSAFADANKLPVEPKAVINGDGNQTYVVLSVGGKPYLYRFNFYDVVDDGDLSADGNRSIIDMSGCEDFANAKYFSDYTCGPSLYYSSGKDVWSFSPLTGQTKANKVYTCEPGEEVTCLYSWGSAGGGWPTSSCILFIATWNESTKTGRLIQFEMNHSTGLPNTMFGPMFGAGDTNPVITTGFQKIVDMTDLDAE